MAGHLTLEEAANALGISTDDFNKRLKSDPLFKTLERGKIRDGASFRFKEASVKELARELGEGSDPGKNTRTVSPSTPVRGTPKVKPEEPLDLSGGDDDDPVFSLAADEPKSSGPKTNKIQRLDTTEPEELAIDFSGPASGVHSIGNSSASKQSAPRSSTKLTSEVTGKNLGNKPKSGTKLPPAGSDSEFELSLDAGSDSAFELKLNTDEDDDSLDLGEMPKDTTGGSRIMRGGESGILSRKPNDTGRSLERSKAKDKTKGPKSGSLPPLPGLSSEGSEADVDFELTLDSGGGGGGLSSTQLKGGGKSKKKLVTDSDSEFELTLDDAGSGSLEGAALGDSESEGSKGDIFETDFEIPPMDPSGSEVVTSDTTDVESESESSETEGETEPSSSEVVLIEDEDEVPARPRSKSSSKLADTEEGDVDLADVDLDVDEDSVGGALAGVSSKMRKEDLEGEEAEVAMAGAGVYRPVPWGIWPAFFLLPAFTLTLIGGLMGFELLQTMWGYQQPRKPVAPLVREVAAQFDMPLPKDQ